MRLPNPTVGPVLQMLAELYPDSSTELTYESPFQLLAAVILSAQCTDARVNRTTPALFAKYPDARAMAQAPIPDLERLVKSCGFYHMKALALKRMAQSVVADHGGEIPNTMEGLTSLRGVGRKTASVILNQAFGLPAIAVDTHVKRVANRLGWAKSGDPVKIEQELKDLVPVQDWGAINGRMILHGRRICTARKPLCDKCEISRYCAFYLTGGVAVTISKPHVKSNSGRKPRKAVPARRKH